jgi:hypothetical protein
MGETAFFKMLRDEARPVYNVVAKSPSKRYFFTVTILLKAPVLIVLQKKLMSNIDLHYTNTRLGL